MQILIVSASQRRSSKSFELAKYIQANILDTYSNVLSSILDLSLYSHLLDNYGVNNEDNVALVREKDEFLSKLYRCDAIIFVVPEWGGMIPPALVNMFLLTANGSANGLPIGHKPAFAVGVSASGGGSNPISLLKAYTSKNSHVTWLPLHAIVQNVEQFLKSKWTPNLSDKYSQVQSRLHIGIQSLLIYSRQLVIVREELVSLSKVHPFGQ
jgi:NAD(P)H-dependent FMN reductase